MFSMFKRKANYSSAYAKTREVQLEAEKDFVAAVKLLRTFDYGAEDLLSNIMSRVDQVLKWEWRMRWRDLSMVHYLQR